MRRSLVFVVLLVACGSRSTGTPAPVCTDASWAAPPNCAATDFEGKLQCIPGLTLSSKSSARREGYTRYDLYLTQAVDHDHPEAGTFKQRLILLHASEDRPMVLSTTGYGLDTRGVLSEPADLLGANQISYEHRYFLPSRPEPTDWSKLNIQQAAEDAHHIVEAFRWLYPKRWVNTGQSKGGMTSVFQRRFHPCDVDATVAYVAPASQGLLDPASLSFLEQVGGEKYAGCRAALTDVRRRLLIRREEVEPLVVGSFEKFGLAKAYEFTIGELDFAFWQYSSPEDPGHGCAAFPGASATAEELAAFLDAVYPVNEAAGDESLAYFQPYFFQCASQLGNAPDHDADLADLLQFPGQNVPAAYLGDLPVPTFDDQVGPDISAWVAQSGQQMLFVYGEFDPWSARPYLPSKVNDSYRFVAPGGNHGSLIQSLSDADREAALSSLARWIGPLAPSSRALSRARPVDNELLERRPRL